MKYVEQTKLAALRRYQNISQKDMAYKLGIELRTYILKEKGESQFKINEMFAIAKILDMEIGEIFLPPDFMNHEVSEKETVNN